jgi:hypothetical protein
MASNVVGVTLGKDTAPVHIIDTRAQADALILGAMEELQVLDVCAEQSVRLTFFLFPTDDTESMTNVGKIFFYAGDRVDYIIVKNPAKARGDLFKDSQLEKQLIEFGAKSITLPPVQGILNCRRLVRHLDCCLGLPPVQGILN